MANDSVVLMGVGDIGPVHDPMDAYSTLVRPILAGGDIRFGQCERIYSDRTVGGLAVDPEFIRGNRPLKPSQMSVFTDCGFDIVSVAGNHMGDYGVDTLLDTIEHFDKKGIKTVGAGRNLQEARRPVIIEKNGVRTAFLAYCSIVIEGYAATKDKGGIAPLRAHQSYVAMDYQPGIPPRVVTVPYEEDLANMVEDITNARKVADVVVLSLHWGLHFIPKMIAEYQPIVAEAAFKAGADLILGHHAHAPKAIESRNGKVCFYSLGNFIFTTDTSKKPTFAKMMKHMGIVPDVEDAPLCPHGKDSKQSLIAKAVLTKGGIKKVSYLPIKIDKQLRPEVLNSGDPRFDENLKFMEWVSEDFPHKFSVEGNEVVITN